LAQHRKKGESTCFLIEVKRGAKFAEGTVSPPLTSPGKEEKEKKRGGN